MSGNHLVIAAGGTGGHMFPAQALAEAMLSQGWRVTLSTDARGARYAGGFPEAVSIRHTASATFARGGLLAKLIAPFRILSGVVASILSFAKDRPTVVAGFGGYPSIPALSAAWVLRVPRLIHEQNGVLGRVNQLFARRVDRIACGTWPTNLPAGIEGVHTGNPVRGAILEHAAAPFPAETAPLHILVMGGSQGARILSDVVPTALTHLPAHLRERLCVSHQARSEDHARVVEAYGNSMLAIEVKPFFDDVPRRITESQLVISRAGASSVADISVIGRPSILIPFAAATGDHQTANARGLVDAEAAVMIPESALDPNSLCEHVLAILSTPGAAARMAENARNHGKPDATDQLVAIVKTLGDRSAP